MRKHANRIDFDTDLDFGFWWREDLNWNLTKLRLLKPHMRKYSLAHLSFDDKVYKEIFEPYLNDAFVEEILEAIHAETPPIEMIIQNGQ